MNILLEKRQGIQYWHVRAFQALGFRAVFFLRPGGYSRGRYLGLNLGLNTCDHRETVLQNRALAFRAAGFGPHWPIVGQQVHGIQFYTVTHQQAGRGWFALSDAPKATDGFFTSEAGLPLAVATADCLPVLFAAPEAKVIAAVHAGWRGIADRILEKAVKIFQRIWNIPPDRLWAALGPAIGPKSFTIKDEVLARLRTLDPHACTLIREFPSAANFDLPKAAIFQLKSSGLLSQQVIALRACTATDPKRYYSYRREGETGRMLGMIQVEP